jgi:hypothetical protein
MAAYAPAVRLELRDGRPHLELGKNDSETGAATLTNLAHSMDAADFVLIDGEVFETEYLRVPDEYTVADDVVLEARRGDTEIALTRAEIDDAVHLGEGVFRLKSGAQLRFLSSATVH